MKVKSILKYLQLPTLLWLAGGDFVLSVNEETALLLKDLLYYLSKHQRMLFTLNHEFHIFCSTVLCLICNLCFHLEYKTVNYRMLREVAAV